MVKIPTEHTSHYAWRTYKDEVIKLILSKDRPDIIEIGAGKASGLRAAVLKSPIKIFGLYDLLTNWK